MILNATKVILPCIKYDDDHDLTLKQHSLCIFNCIVFSENKDTEKYINQIFFFQTKKLFAAQ